MLFRSGVILGYNVNVAALFGNGHIVDAADHFAGLLHNVNDFLKHGDSSFKLSFQRQCDHESGGAHIALGANGAAVIVGDGLRDRQAKAESAMIAVAGIGAVKTLKEMG